MTYSSIPAMMPVSLVDDLVKPSQPIYPYYPPAPVVGASTTLSAPVTPAVNVNTDILHEIRQIKYITSGLAIAIFFILLVLILKKN